MHNIREILARSTHILPEYHPRKPMQTVLRELADALEGDEYTDVYGQGDSLADFEQEVASLFGKEAAVFMPSGVMAQQIALRIWCEQRRRFTIAMHPTAHLEFAEHNGYQFLHQIQRIPFEAPEFLRYRILTVKDFEQLGQEPGAILLELPYRPLGGQLPTWEELLAIKAWAKERGIPLHLDGARIWQCRPFYQKTYAEIAELFDSVYVSFYKDLDGLCGAMLMGSAAFITEARVWQIRHGGRLRTQGPFWLSGKVGMKRVLPQIDQWVLKAQEVAAVLSSFEEISINPNPPHVNMFHLYIRGNAEVLNRRNLDLAEETRLFPFFGFQSSPVPGIAMTEITLGENSLSFPTDALSDFIDKLINSSS